MKKGWKWGDEIERSQPISMPSENLKELPLDKSDMKEVILHAKKNHNATDSEIRERLLDLPTYLKIRFTDNGEETPTSREELIEVLKDLMDCIPTARGEGRHH